MDELADTGVLQWREHAGLGVSVSRLDSLRVQSVV